jgi:hypothetical protein
MVENILQKKKQSDSGIGENNKRRFFNVQVL